MKRVMLDTLYGNLAGVKDLINQLAERRTLRNLQTGPAADDPEKVIYDRTVAVEKAQLALLQMFEDQLSTTIDTYIACHEED